MSNGWVPTAGSRTTWSWGGTLARYGAEVSPGLSLRRWRAGALYLGGLLGPFGGSIVNPMLPELEASFDTTAGLAASSLTVYFIPFAGLLLVSGTLGERWGRRRVVRRAYLCYAVATLSCALSPDIGSFLAGRALQGAANAFTTPLVLAGLADTVPAARLGRTVGLFATCQAAGQSLGPLLGGLSAEVDWRLAFVGVSVVSLLLMTAPPPGAPRREAASTPRWRPLLTAQMALLSLAALGSGTGLIGVGFLVAELARDNFGLSSGGAGSVLLGFGVAGLVLGQLWGRLTDVVAPVFTGVAGGLAGAVLVSLLTAMPSTWALTLCWVGAGGAASLLTISMQRQTVDAVPENRGGAVSTMSAFRFIGSALAPLFLLPLYRSHPTLAFLGAGAAVLLAAMAFGGLVALSRLRERQRPRR